METILEFEPGKFKCEHIQLRFASDGEKNGPTPSFVLSIPGPWSDVLSPSMNLLSHAGPCRKARRLAWQYSRGEPWPALAHGTLDPHTSIVSIPN